MGTPAEFASLGVQLELITKGKDQFQELFEPVFLAMRGSHDGRKLGVLQKDKAAGPFAAAWQSAQASAGLELVDVSVGLSHILISRDQAGLTHATRAARFSAHVLHGYLLKKIEEIVEEEKKIKHITLAEDAERAISNPSLAGAKLNAELIEPCYLPIIQSGGTYNLKPSAESDDKTLRFDTIICSLGARYKGYCANVSRTYMIDPTKEQEEMYGILLALHAHLLAQFLPGNKLGSVMDRALAFLEESAHPELVQHFVANCGFGIGLEFRDSFQLLTKTNERLFRENSVFNLSIGFQNLKLPTSTKMYALLLADVVQVTPEGGKVLAGCPMSWKDIAYFANSGVKTEERGEKIDLQNLPTADTVLLEDRTRGVETNEQRRQRHQQELAQKQRERALGGVSAGPSAVPKTSDPSQLTVYPTVSNYPRELRDSQIFVDMEREAILVPIFGQHVPFSVTTIKNVSKTEDGGVTGVRINFFSPGQTFTTYNPATKFPNSVFIRELSFRSHSHENLLNVVRGIKELRKIITQRESEQREKADIVAQDALILRKQKPPRMTDLNMRPLISGRRTQGTLESHENGFRFTSVRQEKVDILYKNIKHAFFQPGKGEPIVCLLLHLIHPILVNKKKTWDLQFYVEAIEQSQDLGKQKRGYDEEYEERKEREFLASLNQTFQDFTRRVEEMVPDFSFEIPYRELGFTGVPQPIRSSVLLQPSVNCLVHLVDPPFFILTLNEVEIASFERVQFNLKNFDLVFVMRNFANEHELNKQIKRIDSIPLTALDSVKSWLDQMNIKYYENPMNMNWTTILRTIIKAGVEQFYAEDGGWESFLNPDGPEDEQEEEEEEEESEYAPSGSESESDDSDDSASGDSEEDSDSSGSDEGESEESGESWDELERKAAQEDRERAVDRLDDDRRKAPGSNKRSAPPSSSAPPPKKKK
eukprot:TRINITY_DN364_c2_g1_i2.p1 TRINITY_DN364_c2_g1~~TRINITY_DN364_c2_g1_i2.p1  ORF type:complete len:1023 (-),score=283.22 TRINITY_DN364_c2_g1_i2:20-2818(-)